MTVDKKMFTPLTQKESSYTPLSVTGGQACSNCRWFLANGMYGEGGANCYLVDNYPEPIVPNGWCDRWEETPANATEMNPMPVIIVEATEYETDKSKTTPPPTLPKLAAHPPAGWQPDEPNILRKAIDAIIGILKPAKSHTQFKSLGNGYWIAWYSNNLEDREKEIIAAEAHDKFHNRVKAGIMPMPELWFWHIPGTKHGKAIWIDRIDHMTVALGRFDSTPLGDVMKAHYESAPPSYAMSHGFTADKNNSLKNGVWYDINTFEISPLSFDAAANVFTLFSEVKTMASEQALTALKALLTKGMGEADGDKAYQDILSTTETMNKEAEALGTRYKDFTDPAKVETVDTVSTPGTGNSKALDELSKSIAPYLLELTEAQAASVKHQTALVAEIDNLKKAYDGKVTALETTVKRLEAELSLTPKRASEASETELAKAAADALKQRAGDYDDFWADLKVVKS